MAFPGLNVDGIASSPYSRELGRGFWRLGFAADTEHAFAAEHLRRARGRVRAWHSIVLLVLVALILQLVIGYGSGMFVDSWSRGNGELVLAVLTASAVSRALLVILAWGSRFESLYPRVAFPLVAICHSCWAFACGGEILGAHPEYLAPLVTDTFAAYFFSGLVFWQAMIVNLIASASLLLGGWYVAGSITPVLLFAVLFFSNIVMSGVAGYAHERSARSLFLEHALLGEIAALDGLTGLKNRRTFDEHLARVWQQGIREGRALGILMIDVDHFKHYNDCYGHQAGDRALQRIAGLVTVTAQRALDLGARYGGEELAVILYDMDRERVADIAERLRRATRALGIEHLDTEAGVVTISIGAAVVYPTPHRSPQGALQLADEALYTAKTSGRDKVTIFDREYSTLSTGVFERMPSAT